MSFFSLSIASAHYQFTTDVMTDIDDENGYMQSLGQTQTALGT